MTITANDISGTDLPIYADNTAALAGGLSVGSLYKTATGEVRVVI